MELLVFVLNNIEKLDELLIELSNSGLKGATILNSMGMASSIYNSKKQETLLLLTTTSCEEKSGKLFESTVE